MNYIHRENYLNILKGLKGQQIIKVITGIRRCGKSTLLEIYKNYLIDECNIDKEQIIFINFENADYEELEDRHKLYTFIKTKLVSNKMNYIFLDEIQLVKDFEKVVDSLFINKNIDLYITGSNAYLLSSELATLLTGRYIEIKMLPLSFKEYLSAFNEKADLNKMFNNYLTFSSFPQAINLFKINPDYINLFLDGIYNTIVLKDVMNRKNINDKYTLEQIIKYLYDNIGNTTSLKKVTDNLSNVSYNTVSNYVNALLDSYLLFRVDRYDIKGKELLKTQEKYYVIDLAIRMYLLGQSANRDLGHILENVVYLELLRRGFKVYIGKINDLEIDFIAKNSKEINYYQVALTTRAEGEDLERILKCELKPLQLIKDNYPKYLLTLDNDLEVDYEGIKKINVIDWLLK